MCLSRCNTVVGVVSVLSLTQGDHLSGKPGNVREFDSCQGNVRDFTKKLGKCQGKNLARECCLKLFIVISIFVSIQVFRRRRREIQAQANSL